MGPDRRDILSKQQPDFAALALILGHEPHNRDIFKRALTHGSMGEGEDYQRLEFLGDRVLGLVIGSLLYERYPEISEGQLSAYLNRLVSGESCADVSRDIGIAPHIRLGKQARDDGGANSVNILGDVAESLIGALYLDGGLEVASAFIARNWGKQDCRNRQGPAASQIRAAGMGSGAESKNAGV
jgi:ribonuclease-3